MMIELEYVSLAVEQVLGKVPLNLIGLRVVLLQVTIQWALAISLDINFAQKGELDIVGALYPFVDLTLFPGLLFAELIAGTCYDLQAFSATVFIHLLQLMIVGMSQVSFRGYIDGNDCTGALAKLLKGKLLCRVDSTNYYI